MDIIPLDIDIDERVTCMSPPVHDGSKVYVALGTYIGNIYVIEMICDTDTSTSQISIQNTNFIHGVSSHPILSVLLAGVSGSDLLVVFSTLEGGIYFCKKNCGGEFVQSQPLPSGPSLLSLIPGSSTDRVGFLSTSGRDLREIHAEIVIDGSSARVSVLSTRSFKECWSTVRSSYFLDGCVITAEDTGVLRAYSSDSSSTMIGDTGDSVPLLLAVSVDAQRAAVLALTNSGIAYGAALANMAGLGYTQHGSAREQLCDSAICAYHQVCSGGLCAYVLGSAGSLSAVTFILSQPQRNKPAGDPVISTQIIQNSREGLLLLGATAFSGGFIAYDKTRLYFCRPIPA